MLLAAVLLLAAFACFVVVVVVVLFTQCYCEALRAQMRWGALEILFIIIIINSGGKPHVEKLRLIHVDINQVCKDSM